MTNGGLGPEEAFPALAGIDPVIHSPRRMERSFPRARGDRPWDLMTYTGEVDVPPRSRG